MTSDNNKAFRIQVNATFSLYLETFKRFYIVHNYLLHIVSFIQIVLYRSEILTGIVHFRARMRKWLMETLLYLLKEIRLK